MEVSDFCAEFFLLGACEEMQDSVGIRWCDGTLLTVVCDGNGADGAQVAEAAVATLLDQLPDDGSPENRDYIRAIFTLIDHEIRGWTDCATTATAMWLRPGHLSIAYVGDSEVRATMKDSRSLQLTPTLHRPDKPVERTRIESSGGVIKGKRIRVIKNGKPILFGLSRCLGGSCLGDLVIPEPDFFTMNNGMLSQLDCLLIGTDGLHGTLDDTTITCRELRALLSGPSVSAKVERLAPFLAECHPSDNIRGFLIDPRPFVSV